MDTKTWILIAAAALFMAVRFALAKRRAGEAKRLVADGALLVDVRSPQEFAAGHLPGARNIPLQELDRRLGELGPRDRALVVYCRSGMRSASAAQVLQRAGFARVLNLGPMSAW